MKFYIDTEKQINVLSTYEVVADSAEAAYDLAPYVVIYLDGTFGVVAPGEDEKRYNADGTRKD